MIGAIILTAILAVGVSQAFSLYRNYLAAKKTGLPIIIGLIDPLNPLWIITKGLIAPYLALLPGDLGLNSKFNSFGWQFLDKYDAHQRLGKVFIHVTPSKNDINIGDPTVNQNLMSRTKEFVKPCNVYRMTPTDRMCAKLTSARCS